MRVVESNMKSISGTYGIEYVYQAEKIQSFAITVLNSLDFFSLRAQTFGIKFMAFRCIYSITIIIEIL